MIPRIETGLAQAGTLVHILFIILVLALVHLGVSWIRRQGRRLTTSPLGTRMAKTRTLVSLTTSILVFALYFTGFGLIVKEFGLSLKTYLASASIMGLAIGFGSQGLVQDVPLAGTRRTGRDDPQAGDRGDPQEAGRAVRRLDGHHHLRGRAEDVSAVEREGRS